MKTENKEQGIRNAALAKENRHNQAGRTVETPNLGV
jgi:hypothetical protein